MHKITFEISSAFQHLLAEKGLASEIAADGFLERLMQAYAEDVLLGEAAVAAQREGYIGEDASANLLQNMLNAKD